ncbi:hypothetical protein FOCC_FOCC008963 [Frankliniella occidentalis]|nr:hypothetical protein FOCC_FOCC008963 [Frankliniella occidentalis]
MQRKRSSVGKALIVLTKKNKYRVKNVQNKSYFEDNCQRYFELLSGFEAFLCHAKSGFPASLRKKRYLSSSPPIFAALSLRVKRPFHSCPTFGTGDLLYNEIVTINNRVY